MHLLKKIPRKRFGHFGVGVQMTQEQHERLLQSIDADIESLLLEADEAERDVLLALKSIESGSDADAATLAAAEESLDMAEELKRWCRAKRSEAAGLFPQAE
jgi:hypothetical protein